MSRIIPTFLGLVCILGFWLLFSSSRETTTPSPQKAQRTKTTVSASKAPPRTAAQKSQSQRTSHTVSNPKSLQQKTVVHITEDDDAPIVALERPDEIVYPLTKDGISQAMIAFLPNIRDCYEQALETHPQMGGSLKTSFRIERPKEDNTAQDVARISEVEILA